MDNPRDFLTDLLEMASVDGTPIKTVHEIYTKHFGRSTPPHPTEGAIWVKNPETGEIFEWDGKNWVMNVKVIPKS